MIVGLYGLAKECRVRFSPVHGGRGVWSPALAGRGVARGQTELDLRIQTTGDCTVQHVASRGLACGAVSPESFQCGSSDSVVYQHYGCFSDYEIVSFEVSTRPENYSGWEDTDRKLTVEFFSVEIHITEDLHSNLAIKWLDLRLVACQLRAMNT